jgi:hypothetical protein
MGDGNLHPTFRTDERNADEMHRVEDAFKESSLRPSASAARSPANTASA